MRTLGGKEHLIAIESPPYEVFPCSDEGAQPSTVIRPPDKPDRTSIYNQTGQCDKLPKKWLH